MPLAAREAIEPVIQDRQGLPFRQAVMAGRLAEDSPRIIRHSEASLFAINDEAIGWLTGPHRAVVFGGRPPIELVVSGTLDGLLTVRRFLHTACRGEYMSANEVDAEFRGYRDSDIVFS